MNHEESFVHVGHPQHQWYGFDAIRRPTAATVIGTAFHDDESEGLPICVVDQRSRLRMPIHVSLHPFGNDRGRFVPYRASAGILA